MLRPDLGMNDILSLMALGYQLQKTVVDGKGLAIRIRDFSVVVPSQSGGLLFYVRAPVFD